MLRSWVLLTVVALTLVGCASLPHTDPLQVTLVDAEPEAGEANPSTEAEPAGQA